MRKNIQMMVAMLMAVTVAKAQPKPFEIDETFVPTLQFMQKTWTGSYNGVDPNSRTVLTVSRTLVLYDNMTYVNETQGHTNRNQEEVVLKHEEGTYEYDAQTGTLTYTVLSDSTLDFRGYVKDGTKTYTTNDYALLDSLQQNSELAQFTSHANDAQRQWVLFDAQLMSQIDPSKQAVYVMTGTANQPSAIAGMRLSDEGSARCYRLDGRQVTGGLVPRRGQLYVVQGKKRIYK